VDPEAHAAYVDVSGIVVYAAPRRLALLRDALDRIAGVTVHAVSAEGKIVATIEARSEACSMDLFERIRALEGVLQVAMAYHQIETDPDQEV